MNDRLPDPSLNSPPRITPTPSESTTAMSEAFSRQRQAQAAMKVRTRKIREEFRDVHAWYGDPCKCPIPDGQCKQHPGEACRCTRPLGECKKHPRARIEQRPPLGEWRVWVALAGRGWGKSRCGSGFINEEVELGKVQLIGLVGETVKDVRDVMIEGPAGLLATSKPWNRPVYEPSKARVTWPNGAIATIYSAEQPDQLRGPQHDLAWCIARGSLIETDRGRVPIEDVRVGDRVWTRKGLRSVTAATLTKKDHPVVSVLTTSGSLLYCTEDHFVWTQNRGWTRAGRLQHGDVLLEWKRSSQARPGTTSGVGTSGIGTRTGTTRTAPGRSCTRRSGSGRIASKSRRGTRSITSTRIAATIAPTTSNSERRATTPASTSRNALLSIPGTSRSGANRRGPASRACGRTASRATSPAIIAGPSTNRRGCGRNTAPGNAVWTTSVRLVEHSGRTADVYDLAIDDAREFFASSLLVHNCDELAKWSRRQQETWDNLEFGLRLGENPRVVVTTTPQPTPTLKSILKDPFTVTTGGSTYDNAANLAAGFIHRMRERYEGTRLGSQELHAQMLDDFIGALWNTDMIERAFAREVPAGVQLVRMVVGVDPGAGALDPESGAETGIVVAARGSDNHLYVLDDCSVKGTPDEWGRAVVRAYRKHKADRVVAETNNGGDMVQAVIQNAADSMAMESGRPKESIPYKKLWASRNKITRAEPISSLYEQNRGHHVGGFPLLENQLCQWTPGDPSPDRLDALVWAATEVIVGGGAYSPPYGGGHRPGIVVSPSR